MTTLKTETDVRDFVRGCTFMGTGGGGPQTTGLSFLLDDIRNGKTITFTDPATIDDDAWTCVAYYMGSIAPAVPETEAKMKAKGLIKPTVKRELVKAITELQEYMGVKFSGVIPMEIGGINSPAPASAATNLGIPMLDGDYSGRAVPEIAQVTPVLNGHPLTPIVSCDKWGNVVLIKEGSNNEMVEALGKAASTTAFVICGQCGVALKGREMKKVIIPGTMTKSYRLGRSIREAREQGSDPVQAAIKETDGWLLFKGVVTSKDWEDKEGYLQGDCTIKGSGEYANHDYRIWYKNENHITWLDGKPHVLSPDLVEVVQLQTAEPITNTDLQVGDEVAVIGMKNEIFRTEKGLAVLGPKHFGFDYEYIPIEKLVK